jgi:outer membrane immunogenic protein
MTLQKGHEALGIQMKLAAVLGGVALVCLACVPGRAADLSPIAVGPYKAAPGYIPAYFSWTGYYLGVDVGGGFGKATVTDPFDSLVSTPSLNGFLLGGYTGVNYQVNSIVFGFEGDFTGSWAKGSVLDPMGDTITTDMFWTGTIAARLGWAFDRLLLFVKGGGAFAYHRDKISGPNPPGGPTGSAVVSTWTLGGGIEWAMTEHWIARGEYDYFNLPTKAETVMVPINTSVVSAKFNELKAGVAYKF